MSAGRGAAGAAGAKWQICLAQYSLYVSSYYYMCVLMLLYVYLCAQGEGLHGQNGKYASLHIRVAYGSSKYQGRDEVEGERAQTFIT